MLVVLLFCVGLHFAAGTKFVTKIEHINGGVNVYAFKESDPNGNWVCIALYNNTYNSTGWDTLQIQTDPTNTGFTQGQCAGLVEGIATVNAIYIHYSNNVKDWCKSQNCTEIKLFARRHVKWVLKNTAKKAGTDPRWAQVLVLVGQMFGLFTGYNSAQTDPDKKLTMSDFLLMNLMDDLEDVGAALSRDTSAKLRGNTRCSAMIKLASNNSDILIGHNTWTSYNQMYRMVKNYGMPLNTTDRSKKPVPGSNIIFSGYPGVCSSGDDFYVTNTGLVAMETTIGNNNASRWKHVKPTGQLFETVRSLIAMRLATNGSTWCDIFRRMNSGTYNNQWMIVDFKTFSKGQPLQKGLLFVLEQIPGYIRSEDQTSLLERQSYWASYNVPYYQDVFNMSGNQELVDQYGDWFSYNKTPRALIFRRDSHAVKDVGSMLRLLRSNNYTRDPYSACNCTPPYSAENAIAARSDLNPKNGSYPFPALGHRPHGAIDAKVTSLGLARNMTFMAVCGPTGQEGNVPAFNWNTSDFSHLPHMGQPDVFKFPPIIPVWDQE